MRRFLGLVSIFILLALPARAQNYIPTPGDFLQPAALPFQLPGLDLNFSGAGVAARGMGGAYLGVSGDLSSIGYNPAGLSTLNRTQTSIVYRYNRPGIRTQQANPGVQNPVIDQKNIDSFDGLDFGAVASTGKIVGHTFVGAFAYSTVADQFYADRADGFIPLELNGVISIANAAFDRQSSGKLGAFNFAAATRYGKFSFGANFQIYQGGSSDTLNLFIGPFTVNKENGEETAVFKQRLANKVDYRGSSLLLGAQVEYKKARLGVAGRVPSFGSGRKNVFALKSNMDIGLYDTVLVSGLPDVSVLPGLLFFTDSYLKLPLSASVGLSYTFGKSLLVDFDYTYTNWGAAELKTRRFFVFPFSNFATLQLGSASVGMTSTHQVRLGWEYNFNPGFGQVAVRGGVRNLPIRTLTSLFPFSSAYFPTYEDSVIKDAQGNDIDTISTVKLVYDNFDEDRSAKGFGASAGLGVRWNQVVLDVAYDYTTYLRASRASSATLFHRLRQHRVFVGFTGYFTRL